jgi:predicted peptidase
MDMTHPLTVLLCVALASCTTLPQTHELIKDSTSLRRDVFDAVSLARFESAVFTSSRGRDVLYRLLRPSRQIPGKAYPLVVQLHGSGGIGTDNAAQVDRMAMSWAMPDIRERYQAFVLIPQFPIRSANYGPAAPDQHAVPSEALDDALELLAEFSSVNAVDRSRIYATGFSMGGSAAWLLPHLDPEMFAAIVPISGIAPSDSQAFQVAKLPILAIHGNADSENPMTADRRFIQAIVSQGGRSARLREYQGLDHQPPADMYPGLWWRDWLFSQQRE